LALGIASAEIKSKLEDLLGLLQRDTTQLVDNSDPTKAIFKTLRGQIPADAEEALLQVAHLESRQLQYQKAVQCLADRAAQAHLKEEMMRHRYTRYVDTIVFSKLQIFSNSATTSFSDSANTSSVF
jgi:hypothetical protein